MQQLLLLSLPFVFQIGVISTIMSYLKLLSRIRETGSVMPVKKKGVARAPRQAREVEVEEAVLERLWMMTQEEVFV
jgi:hypothetical protein